MAEIEIEGYAAAWGILCNGKSLIAEGAFRHLIASGTWAPAMLWHHEPGNVAGRWTGFEEDDRGLFVRGVIDLALPYGRVAFNRVSTGEAIGLSTKDVSLHKPVSPTVVQIDRVLSCREISIVTRPGCPLALISRLGDRQFGTETKVY